MERKLLYDVSINGDCDYLPGNKFAACFQRIFRRTLEPAAAGNLHAHNGDALDVVLGDDLRELLRVVNTVQFGVIKRQPGTFFCRQIRRRYRQSPGNRYAPHKNP